jgi:hypothetical protein
MKKVKTHHVFIVTVAVLGAAIGVEKFYSHPTYGNGLDAALAAARAALLLT